MRTIPSKKDFSGGGIYNPKKIVSISGIAIGSNEAAPKSPVLSCALFTSYIFVFPSETPKIIELSFANIAIKAAISNIISSADIK